MATIKYYNEKLRAAIYALPVHVVGKYASIVERLQKYGADVQAMPNMRYLYDNLWEIRAVSARVFYFWSDGETIYMLHFFLKKSDKTPKRELEKAIKRMQEVKNARQI